MRTTGNRSEINCNKSVIKCLEPYSPNGFSVLCKVGVRSRCSTNAAFNALYTKEKEKVTKKKLKIKRYT
ncbi:hypothetical protein BHL27_26880 [Bacillus cereus]|nr:hypothetical protein BHL27_26880 [Bacillus cereus]